MVTLTRQIQKKSAQSCPGCQDWSSGQCGHRHRQFLLLLFAATQLASSSHGTQSDSQGSVSMVFLWLAEPQGSECGLPLVC